ncbi:disease resistance protein RPM1 isoform X2 [Elaeis guineensis]|uniref:Disease resistance protein RPM1 isoform X2 n=1 Tax=Elaeis guineensis var. tenera TaxID=51953 RepID=A0A6I9SCR3_ELAGV|nr:disease resistance protein RPM1 isoform X2 [Elaeis guineensis]
MADIAMNLLLRKVATMLSEEADLLGGLRAEVEDIEHELIGMQNFLTTGEASIVKNCVDEVRELAYDTEDCIDSFRLHIAKESRPKKEDGCICFLDEGIHYLKTLLRRYQIAKEIKKIKAKAERLHQIRSRYQTLPGSSTRQESLHGRNDARSAAPCVDEDQLVGMEERRSKLMQLLLGGDGQLTVISVVGLGGSGKTTVAWNLFEDEGVKETFKYRAWIDVPQQSDYWVLLRNLIRQLQHDRKDLPQGLGSMAELQLANQLKRFLRDKKYMIILDDVREPSVWERIAGAFPNTNNGSRVMVTSQLQNIASYDIGGCVYANHLYQLPDLEYHEAWKLFRRRAFRANPEFACPEELTDVAERIVKRCAGLPLAIETVGGLLKNKPQIPYEWNRFHCSLIPELQSNSRLASVQRILSLGYDDLPAHLKPCILCFCAFQVIKQKRLMRIWIAEGFVQSVEGKTQEEVARDYLKELADRSMVQVSESDPPGGTTKICRVHGFMHEILKFKCTEQSAYRLLEERHDGNNNQHDLASPVPPSRKIRRLSLRGSSQIYEGMASLLQRDDCGSSLRSLIIAIGDQTPILFPSLDLPNKFVMLRMLDLEGTKVSRLSGQIDSCRLLRYLSLRDTNLDSLPKSMGKLLNLETLDLRGTQITTLPDEVTNLHRLHSLHVSCPTPPGRTSRDITHAAWYELAALQGVSAPRGVRRLTRLVKLALFDVGHDDVLKELQDLTQLRKLGVRCIRRGNGKDVCDAIQQMSCLRSLVLHSVGTDELLDLQSLSSPPPLLEHLFLAGPLEKLPTWAKSLRFIVKIVLVGSRLKDDLFDAFQGLPNLTHLSLIEAFAGTHLCSSNGSGFKQLKILHLSNLNELVSVTVAKGAMPALGTLSIWYCGALQQVPSGIEHLTGLKELHLLGMQEEFVCRLRVGGTERGKVAHIPIIRSRTYIKSQAGDWSGWIDEDLLAPIALEMEEEEEEEGGEEGRRTGSFVEERDGDTIKWRRYNSSEDMALGDRR